MSAYLKVLPGEELTVIFQGFKEIPSTYDPEKTAIQYSFIVEGEKKYWTNGSPKVAIFFDDKKEGDIVKIKNVGVADKGKYELSAVITQGEVKV